MHVHIVEEDLQIAAHIASMNGDYIVEMNPWSSAN